MLFRPLRPLWALSLLLPLACKDPDTAAVQGREQKFQLKMNEGRDLMANGQPDVAARVFQSAASLAPDNTEPLVLLAEAQRRAGNSGAAILALKQAMALNPAEAPALKRKLAERYEQDGLFPQAISILSELRDAEQLGDLDLLKLAHLQTQVGQHDAAFQTLDRILSRRPDDADAKAVEAEALLAKGEELRAATLMDKLLTEQPGLSAARVLRARYALANGYPQLAAQDLDLLPPEEASRPEVVALRARVLSVLKRFDEAQTLLTQTVALYPRNADLIARLAELKLTMGNKEEALAQVEQALKVQPESVRALYVRGYVQEQKGDLRQAREDYQHALTENPRFAPALSRMWRLNQQAGELQEAISCLERLVDSKESTLEERVALADLYSRVKVKSEQGLKFIAEALKQEPGNFEYLDIQKELKKNLPKKKGPSGPVIIRGGRR